MRTQLTNHGNSINIERDAKIKFKVSGGNCVIHMAFEKQHLAKYAYKLHCYNHPLDGKELFKEVYTPKSKTGNFGKAKVCFYLNEPDSKIYDSIQEFMDEYGLEINKE